MKYQVLASRMKKKWARKHDCLSKRYNKCEALATRVDHLNVNKKTDEYRKNTEEERVVFPNLITTTKQNKPPPQHFQEIATI